METVECSICHEPFDIEYEGVDIDDKYCCEDCRWEYTWPCQLCGNSELEDKKGDIGTMLIVNEAIEGASPGIYEITEHPYYCQGLCSGGWIFRSAIKWVGPVPTGENKIETYDYPCGHVCRWCDDKVKRRAILSRRF